MLILIRSYINLKSRTSSVLSIQLRESIASDQDRTEALKSQMQELENDIQHLDNNIHNTEVTLKDLRKLQERIATKTAERSILFKEQERQYAALTEENEGLCIDTIISCFL